MKKIVTMVFLCLVTFLLAGCGDIRLNKSSNDYIGNNYQMVTGELNELGFTNIETIEIADLTSQGSMADGAVSEIAINGTTDFTSKATFPKDAEIIIIYHVIPKIAVPVTQNQIPDMEYTEIADAFTNAGFTNVHTETRYDLDPEKTDVPCRNEIKINETTLTTDQSGIPFDADIAVICHYPYEKYDVTLKIDFIGNLIFNKYDVDLFINDRKQDTLKHGEDWETTLRLKKGEYTLTFSSTKDSSTNGKVTLEVDSKIDAEYRISCQSSKIDIDTMYVDKDIELAKNEVKLPCAESDYRGKNVKTVEKELSDLGFTNIETIPVYDIIWGFTETESIETITINGTDDFKRGEIVSNGAEIIITYHMPYEDDPEKASSDSESNDPEDSTERNDYETELANMNDMVINNTYVSVRDLMIELGYTAKYRHAISNVDFTEELTYYTDTELNDAGFIITGIEEMDSEQKTITLYVNTVENIEEAERQRELKQTLEENFDPAVALATMERYGKSQYPYGFKIHMVTGRLAETPIDENTWFMKYTCKITNAYGEKIDMTCEAKIKGPENNPTVYDFYVY